MNNRPLPWNRQDWFHILLMVGLVMLFYWRILTPNLADRQSFPPGDFSHQFWAFTTFEARQFAAGELPLWNPYTYAGAPFWADVQSAVFYPPSLLTLLFSAPWGFSLFALEIEAIAHIGLAGLFMYLFIRQQTHHRTAALLAALTFSFSGYLSGYPSQQLAVLEADVWLPLILYGLSRSTPSLLAGGALGMALLAGHPQSGFIVASISLAYAGFLFYTAHGWPTKATLSSLLLTFLFVPLGLGLAAIQFIPAIEYTRLSVRAAGTYEAMSGGFPLTDLVQIILPGVVSHYSPLYIGVIGLMVAGVALFSRHAHQREATFWGSIAGLSLLISFGGNTFFYSPFYLMFPGFSIFRGQERWAFATVFSLCVLIGYGWLQLNMLIRDHHKVMTGWLIYMLGFGVFLMGLFFYGLNDTGWSAENPFYGLMEAATFLTIMLALTWGVWHLAPSLSTHQLAYLTTLLLCFDLFSVHWQTNLYPQLPEWHTQIPATVQAINGDNPTEPFRVYNEFRLYDNYGVPFALEDIWGASPLRLARYAEFMAPPMPIERTWELLNVQYVISWRAELYKPSTIIHQEPAEDGSTYVHRLEEVGPRAWVVHQAELMDDATMLQTIADPHFDRWHIALLEPHEDAAMWQSFLPDTPPAQASTIISHTLTPHHQRYQVTTPQPALLVISEPDYPGWWATVNGQAAPILRADYILRAIPLPAGASTVELQFWPLSFIYGALISGLTLFLMGILWLRRP